MRYVKEIVAPTLEKRAPTAQESDALRDLDARLAKLPQSVQAEDIQSVVYEVGKAHDFDPLRSWFSALYETLLGSPQADSGRRAAASQRSVAQCPSKTNKDLQDSQATGSHRF